MPLPTLRLPMASTSSLEFLGLTVSFCSIGFCCPAWVCSEAGRVLAGSGVGGGLWAQAVPVASPPKSANLSVCRRMSFMSPPPACAYPQYTPVNAGLNLHIAPLTTMLASRRRFPCCFQTFPAKRAKKLSFFFRGGAAAPEYTLSLHAALPI